MRRVLIVGFGLALAASISGGAAPQSPSRLMYVSVQRVAAQSVLGQASAKRLDATRQEKSRALAQKQQQVESLRLQIAQSGGLFSRSKQAQLKTEEERQRAEFERLKESAQNEIQSLQREIQTGFQNDLRTALALLAAERDADMVLNADTAVVWTRPGLDLTDEVIKRMDAAEAARKKKRP